MINTLTFSQLQQQDGIAIDTRQSAFYNGWPQTQYSPEGHEPGALNLAAHWLPAISDKQLNAWLKEHAVQPATAVALYGETESNNAVAQRLEKAGINRINILSDALQQPGRLQKLRHFEQLVYPYWLQQLLQGQPVAASPAGDWKIIEVGTRTYEHYLLAHIPGAGYIDTCDVEQPPLWNKVSDARLKRWLAKNGIRHNTTVILYSRNICASARVALMMLYAGVQDVRLLDGGWQSWSDAGLATEQDVPGTSLAEVDFGAPFPARPGLIINTEQARELLYRRDASLVSIRSWAEFTGMTSGYSYIQPKGDIAGARWGHAGSDALHLEAFQNPDGSMRCADDIAAMWKNWHITREQQIAFYCGTGWRAAAAFMFARAMGWQRISVYDGGWYQWSQDPANPVVRGDRGPESTY